MFFNDAAYIVLKQLYMPTPLAIYLDWLHSLVCVGLGWNLEYMFYYDTANIIKYILKHFLCKYR